MRTRQNPKLASFGRNQDLRVFFRAYNTRNAPETFSGVTRASPAPILMSLTPGGPLNPVRAPKTSDFSILAWVLTSGSPLLSREFRFKARKISGSEKSIDFFSKTKPQIKNPLQRFEALYVGWLWSKYEAKRPSGYEDYRL